MVKFRGPEKQKFYFKPITKKGAILGTSMLGVQTEDLDEKSRLLVPEHLNHLQWICFANL